jgi:hypothetical protein
MKRVAPDKDEPIIGIPEVGRIIPVRVEPKPVIVPFHIEDVQVAIRVRNVQDAVNTTIR